MARSMFTYLLTYLFTYCYFLQFNYKSLHNYLTLTATL